MSEQEKRAWLIGFVMGVCLMVAAVTVLATILNLGMS